MFKKYFLCASLILLLVAAGCGAEETNTVTNLGAGSAAPKKEGIITELTEKQNGGVVALVVNDVVRVKLDGNITTGYSWEVDNLDATLLQKVGEVEYASTSSLTGGGGVFTLTFKALNIGTTHLHLIYHRAFEKGVPPIRVFDVTVDIQK